MEGQNLVYNMCDGKIRYLCMSRDQTVCLVKTGKPNFKEDPGSGNKEPKVGNLWRGFKDDPV